MTVTPRFYGNVDKDGRLHLTDKRKFDAYLSTLTGKDVQLEIEKVRNSRTNQQNKYYWGAVVEIPAEHFGYTPEEMHEAFKFLFLRREEPGKPPTVRSTASLSTDEFSHYVDKCIRWAAGEGLVIPDPGDIVLHQ